MQKRTVVLFAVLIVGLYFSILSVYHLSSGTELAQAAVQQQTYKVNVFSTRGTIYDCHLNALTGNGREYVASIVPSVEVSAELNKIFPAAKMQTIYPMLTTGKPFALRLPWEISLPDADVFTVSSRYSASQSAVHILGYLNGSGAGAAGAEKAFNSQLTRNQGKISVSYPVDAMNRVLSGGQKTVEDTSYLQKSGVVLTLDRRVQALAEDAANKYIKKGAVVVVEVPSCKLRAVVSRPAYSPDDVASVLDSKDSPLVNRALSSYSVGSVFKLVAAAAALEDGISPQETYTCTGSIMVDGNAFHCFNSESHGTETMKEAIANSCNTYFVNLMQKIPPADFVEMAQKLGFGRSFVLASGLSSDAGVLPTAKELAVPRALANFSFGQGNLTANPLQIAAMVNAIASGGCFTQPSLYEGLVNEKLQITQRAEQPEGKQVMTGKTAELLRQFMKASIDGGTSKKGKPLFLEAGAKTATAQTGRYVGGEEMDESWFAGFYPYENPRYAVVVFAEGGSGGGTTCGPAFRDLADGLYGLGLVD